MLAPIMLHTHDCCEQAITLIDPASLRCRLPWPTEEQDVAVRVANLEPAKTVAGILERHAKCCAMIGKFAGERIWVWGIDEGIQAQVAMTRMVRHWRYVPLGLDEDLRSVAADDGEKRIPIRLLESRLKTKLIAVKGDGLIDVADDEESGNALCVRSCHKHGRSCCESIIGYQRGMTDSCR